MKTGIIENKARTSRISTIEQKGESPEKGPPSQLRQLENKNAVDLARRGNSKGRARFAIIPVFVVLDCERISELPGGALMYIRGTNI